MGRISRRDLLKSAAAAASYAAWGDAAASGAAPPASAAASGLPLLPFDSTSGVYIPPRGRSFQKFSFGFPEPSVEFAGMKFSFRVYTFENAYGLDRSRMTATETPDGIEIHCSGLVWAGGQEKAPGQLHSRIRRNGSYVEWSVTAEMDRPVKSVSAIVRGVPRGRIAGGSGRFFDPRDDELLFGYPFGGGSHHLARGLDSPLVVVQAGESEYFFLSSLLEDVRATRFYFQPGEKEYRVELVHEREGWKKSNRLQGPTWRAGRVGSAEAAFRPHFEHVQRAFRLPLWEQRRDVPAWFRETALVLSIHGMHWTGYVFNDFARARRILDWVAGRIPARNVLVFLPAWDGRYYWDYPLYQPHPRLGGEAGFRSLIEQGHRQGFRFLPMFGLNSANQRLPVFSKFADATTAQIDGDAFDLNWVDWDNDRHREGWMPYMNVGVASWRNWLLARIADTIERFGVDGYFLDISGGWENNTKADMHEGARQLVLDLRRKFPHVLPCGEFAYDALMAFLPVYQIFPSWGYPPAFQKYGRAFQHLSHPAPGRGSSGVHESGFGHFNPKTLSLSPHQIPTITIVDDTFDRHRDAMAEIIARARQRAGV